MSSASFTTLAITGGTGFVGKHLIATARAQGFTLRALTRRPQADLDGVHWVAGTLEDKDSLERLMQGAQAVLHIAGTINARTRAEFDRGNVTGTQNMLAAAERQGIARFIHLSSLSVREPQLSDYGASKAEAEQLVRASNRTWTILRPPAVYGPADHETLQVFRMVARGLAILPGKGRFSLIHVHDLAEALLALLDAPHTKGQCYEISDGTPQGLSHGDMARLIAQALGTKPLMLPLPAQALKLGAALDTLWAKMGGKLPKLSFDRANYLAHPDWTADPQALMAATAWRPRYDPASGIAQTAHWYRSQGWL